MKTVTLYPISGKSQDFSGLLGSISGVRVNQIGVDVEIRGTPQQIDQVVQVAARFGYRASEIQDA
jgi:hypothetical protein